jgi:hypothetical protein
MKNMNIDRIKQFIQIDEQIINYFLSRFERKTNKNVMVKDYQVIFLSSNSIVIKFGYIKNLVCYAKLSLGDVTEEKYKIDFESKFQARYNRYI